MEVKLTKTITNQYIIGKTTQKFDYLYIDKPYMVIPDPTGIQIFPYDEAIIGIPLESINIKIDSVLYSTETGQDIRNTYLEAISGIEVPEKKLILG